MSTTEQENVNGHAPVADLVALPDATVAGDQTTGEPVRSEPAYTVTEVAGKRRAIVPEAWQRGNRRETLKRHGELHWYRTRYHGFRSPAYLSRLVRYGIVGAMRLLARLASWTHWTDGAKLESRAVALGTTEGHKLALGVHTEAKKTRSRRLRILAAWSVPVAGAVIAGLVFVPWWGWALLGLAALPVLARHGRPEGKAIVQAAVVPERFQAPTFELISSALGSILTPVKAALKSGPLDFIVDVHPDGPGWSTQLNLPPGVTATMVMNKRAELSSAGRWPLSATWPSGVPDHHEGRLELWIGQRDISKGRPPAHPLVKGGTADVFGKVPFGRTPRGKLVSIPLFEKNWMIGSAPGQGKTSSVRSMLAGAAIDPMCDLWIHEHSGKGDLEQFKKIAYRYVSGTDDESIEYSAESMSMLRREYDERIKRYNRLRALGQAPDYKVTRDHARADQRLRPIIAVFDECQNIFMHPTFKEVAITDSGYIIRVSRAIGIILILSTQRPTAECVPTAVTGNIVCRFCLCVPGQPENDAILGTGNYRRGYDATQFRPASPEGNGGDAGMGWLKADDVPQVVKSFYLNDKDTARLTERARAIREKAGVLSGVALDESPDDTARNFAADVLSIFGTDTRLWSETIASRLRMGIPEAYADITPDAVASQLRKIGVAVVDVREVGKQNRKGARREDVAAVAASEGAGDGAS